MKKVGKVGNNNLKKFCKINQQIKNSHMSFISSNSGTGKTTYWKWLLCRKALKGEKLDILFRFEGDLVDKFNVSKWLTPPQNASKRLLKLIERLDIIKVGGKEGEDYFLINKETKEKVGQAIAINTQRKVKSTENPLFTKYAFFDEIMPDDNFYCPDEVYKFSRLIDSRARYRNYFIIGLYNKTNPYFPYKESFGKAGATFIDFVGEKYGQKVYSGIQKILSLSDYGEIYNNNNYHYFKEFYKNESGRNKETIFYICVQSFLFSFKDCNDFFLLIPAKKVKKNREVFSCSLQGNDYQVIDRQLGLIQALSNAINRRQVFVNNKKYTVFIKELADFLNLRYNV